MTGIGDIIIRNRAMMEQLRRIAIDTTFERFCEAARNYYGKGWDNGELSILVRELMDLGANPEVLLDKELEIMEEAGEKRLA